jgi:predicted dehydrogenase
MNQPAQILSYAIVGCGVVAKKHLKAARYQQNKCRTIKISATVDTRPGAAAAMLRAAGFSEREISSVPQYDDYMEMLKEVRPDVVSITTPSGSHAKIALAAIEAGAHVLIEKPLTLSLSEADQILTRAREMNRKVAVGHIYRFFPMVAAIRQDIVAGTFGRVLYGDVKVRWGHDQAYYDQAAWRGTWRMDGGALMNQSIHAMDLMTWLLGQPVRHATGSIFRQTHRMEAEDLGFAILELENQVQCLVEGTTTTDPGRHEATFFIRLSAGEIRGGIVAGKADMKVYDQTGRNVAGRYKRIFFWETFRSGGLAALLQLANPHSGLLGDFIEAIQEQCEPRSDGQCGRDALETVLAIYQSSRTKKRSTLPIDGFQLSDMQQYFDEV